MSAAWISRRSAISAASRGSGAISTSCRPLRSICHRRWIVPQPSCCAIASALSRSSARLQRAGVRARLGARRRVQALHQPAQELRRIDSEVVRLVELGESARPHRRKAPAASNRRMRPRSASPSMSRTCSAVTAPAPWAIAWSRIERPSRAEPSAARGDHARARPVRPRPPRHSTTSAKCAASFSAGIRLRSKRWQRDSTVTGTLFDLGRREEELHMLRRLLKSLQQAIESLSWKACGLRR